MKSLCVFKSKFMEERMNKFYEVFSLVAGVAAVITLTYFLLTGESRCLYFLEPYWFIRIPEIIIGFIVLPYYIIKFKEVMQK